MKKKKKKHVWQSFPCSAFRSKLAKIQPMGEHFHLPPPLHTVCNSCFSQEGGPLYSLLAISVGSIWSALNRLKHEEARFTATATLDKALQFNEA